MRGKRLSMAREPRIPVSSARRLYRKQSYGKVRGGSPPDRSRTLRRWHYLFLGSRHSIDLMPHFPVAKP